MCLSAMRSSSRNGMGPFHCSHDRESLTACFKCAGDCDGSIHRHMKMRISGTKMIILGMKMIMFGVKMMIFILVSDSSVQSAV